MKKVVGIIGGMGPMATADLYIKIIGSTPASCDQEHLRVMIDGNTDIPDRTKAILGKGESPLPQLLDSAEKLLSIGAKVLCMPCNTAHYYYEPVAKRVRELDCGAVVVNMLSETAAEAKRLGLVRVGLLATDGTVSSGVYMRAFEAQGIEVMLPDAAGQREVMAMIYDGIKAGNYGFDDCGFREAVRGLFGRGAEAVILGCTELPLAFSRYGYTERNIDPTDVLSKAVVREAMRE